MKSQLPQFLWPIVRMLCKPRHRNRICVETPDMKRLDGTNMVFDIFHRTYIVGPKKA
jgi:hypothetical protein